MKSAEEGGGVEFLVRSNLDRLSQGIFFRRRIDRNFIASYSQRIPLGQPSDLSGRGIFEALAARPRPTHLHGNWIAGQRD